MIRHRDMSGANNHVVGYVQSTAPAGGYLKQGHAWYDSDDDKLFLYTGSAWVEYLSSTAAATLVADLLGTALLGSQTVTVTDNGDETYTVAAALQMSVVSDANGVMLAGDTDVPGTNRVYGTDGAGTKGWRDMSAAETKHIRFAIADPSGVYDISPRVCLVPALDAGITVTRVTATCDTNPSTELDWNLKRADSFIGLENAAVINALDTVDGVLDDSSITSATVAIGSCIYVEFDAEPNADVASVAVDVEYEVTL